MSGLVLIISFPEQWGGGSEEAEKFLYPHAVKPEAVQSFLTKTFGENALLVGIRNSKPDMLDGWRCSDVQFDWIDKTQAPENS